MDNLARKLRDTWTYADYLQWPDAPRMELMDGTAYDMSPAPSLLHQRAVLGIASQLHDQLEGHPCEAFVAPFDVRLPRAGEADDEVDTVVQPDVLVVCDDAKLDDRGCRGAPDFVVEVLSASSLIVDQSLKVELYERHGVREYWIVHPTDRVVFVRVFDEEARRYGPVRAFDASGPVELTVVPNLRVDFGPIFTDSRVKASAAQPQSAPTPGNAPPADGQ